MSVESDNTVDMQTPDGGANTPDEPRSAEEQLQKEVAELREKNLRLIAEGRNLTQRLQREKEEALRFAEADFARALLVVLDNLQRTQDSAAQGADAATIADGVRITAEQFYKLLKDHRVEPIMTEGKPFDPALHEALLQQPSDDVPAGHVLKELQRGYRMHDRVLRAARVIVSTCPAGA